MTVQHQLLQKIREENLNLLCEFLCEQRLVKTDDTTKFKQDRNHMLESYIQGLDKALLIMGMPDTVASWTLKNMNDQVLDKP